MKTFLECAIDLAALGFVVFPVTAGKKKKPLVTRFWERGSSDPDVIRRLWKYDAALESAEAYNPAISTTRFMDGALFVLDVDKKHGGWESLEELQTIHGRLPDTYEQRTPGGGAHLFFRIPSACAGSEGELALGLDVRSHHNYVLGAGAEIDAGVYTAVVRPVEPAPAWLLAWALAHPPGASRAEDVAPIDVDRTAALRRAHAYLTSLAPAPDGQRDASAYKAAAMLRELGLAEDDAREQMTLWFRFEGAFTNGEIAHAVQSAYKYATGVAGGAAAERHFAPVQADRLDEEETAYLLDPKARIDAGAREQEPGGDDPRAWLNRDHSLVMLGNKARVMWEHLNHRGRPVREFLSLEDFRARYAGNQMPDSKGKKMLEVADQWLRWRYRRSHDAVIFAPGQQLSARFYNTWRGFAHEPLAPSEVPTPGMREAVDMWRTVLLENYCAGNQEHARWLTSYYAHMIQKPQEKPRVALVFKGGRGIGKSMCNRLVGDLLEPHVFVASDQRYLVGNFNAHMNETSLFILEEAFWGGNKAAESVLKDVVTRETVTIEQKFREAFRTENYMRVVIIGNEEWQVPAALKDERRWAVFQAEMRFMPFSTPGDKMKAALWFERLVKLMENGGYRYLLTYLQQFDRGDTSVHAAPVTDGLVEQIEHALPPLHQWWLACLRDGYLVEGDAGGSWPRDVEKSQFRDAFFRYCDKQRIDSRRPTAAVIGRELHAVCPSVLLDKKNTNNAWIYRLPCLPVAREEWARVVGRAPAWPDEEDY